MDEILLEFTNETKDLTTQLESILEEVEEDPSEYKKLESFGQVVDRIMGGAKVLALDLPAGHPMQFIGAYAELCKLIGYKASQSGDKPDLITVSVSFLLDATEMLVELNDMIASEQKCDVKDIVRATFLDRLKWLSTKFDDRLSGSVAVPGAGEKDRVPRSLEQDVNAILQQLGVKTNK